MNLRFRLNLIVTVILLIVLVIGSIVTVHNARESVRAEVDSTMDLALHMLDAELAHFNRGGAASTIDKTGAFDLGRFAGVRHLRIEFFNNRDLLVDSNRPGDVPDQEQPPRWFIDQMRSGLDSIEIKDIPVSVNNEPVGRLVISPEPGNEINEAWVETRTMLGLIALFFVGVNLVVYIAVAISLKPIDQVIDALTDMEEGHLDRRLPVFGLPEMANISRKFNGMATALQVSTRNNHRLTQQLLRLQEAERKSLAHELHDEIGQHLTAIHVDASVIKGCHDLAEAKQSAVAIDAVVRQMMDIVRSMLHKLRPGGLDGERFVEALQDLINNWQERHQKVDVSCRFSGHFNALADDVQLTLYRVMQECLTNISRHSAATKVSIDVEEDQHVIQMTIADNGRGFEPGKKHRRFGLAGMQERVDSINGKLTINAAINKGVEIQVQISKQGKLS